MTNRFNMFYDIFENDNIADTGISFFNTVGHLCEARPKFTSNDAYDLVTSMMGVKIDFDKDDYEAFESILQISCLGFLKQDVFDYRIGNEFITYFAVEVRCDRESAFVIKNIQRTLMKCSNVHTIILFKAGNDYVVSHGLRLVGKKSLVSYSPWLSNDKIAEEVISRISVENLSFRTIMHFSRDFREAIDRSFYDLSIDLSYETIAYTIMPYYLDEIGHEGDTVSKKVRDDFVNWYRMEHLSEQSFDDLDDDNRIFLRKDALFEDEDEDYQVDINELELRFLEEELKKELYGEDEDESFDSDFTDAEEESFESAIKLVDRIGDPDDDIEEFLSEIDEMIEVSKKASYDNTFSTKSNSQSKSFVSDSICDLLVLNGNVFPLYLRRTSWKTPTLFFVVEKIVGNYAYGYMIKDGNKEKNTSFPLKKDGIIWSLHSHI